MALVDSVFYEDKYGGNAIDDELFDRLYRKAENILNRMTFGRICAVDGVYGQRILYCTHEEFEAFTEEELAALKYGMCSLMEAVMKLDNAEQQALAGNSSSANVKSRSSGGESVSYESRKTAYDEALTSSTKREELFRDALMEYMQPCIFRHNPFYAGSR